MVPDGKSIVTQIQELHESPEYNLYKSLESFNISRYIFDINYLDLVKILAFLTIDEKSEYLSDVRNRDKLDEFLRETIRLLHNFVAAAMSLVDHTRNIYMKLYSGTEKFPDYQDRVNKDFANEPLAQFVQGLRQFCLHYRAPDISLLLTFNEGKMKKTVNLLKKDLIMFDSWNANAKEYLDLIENHVDVLF